MRRIAVLEVEYDTEGTVPTAVRWERRLSGDQIRNVHVEVRTDDSLPRVER